MQTDQKDTFFVTTPIYYSNGIPHIGHAYSSFVADVLARRNTIEGKRVKFSTGVDENSQKIIQSAESQGKDVQAYLDEMAGKHRDVWDGLDITYTDFIRTTEPRHHALVQDVLQKSFDAGDIYEGEYEGKYCVGCEAFKKDDDLIERDGALVCPDHLRVPDTIKEKNYFFKLSKYEDALKQFYQDNPHFIVPPERFNEVKAFVGRGLDDFSISRETNTFGIPLPFDSEQVTYVWYDALFNYVTVTRSPDDGGDDTDFWPANLHVVGKDIIRFHGIYWPAMLMSAGYELPKQILTTGFLTVDGQKISKSLGNVIDPVAFSREYSKDALKLYLLSGFPIGTDGDFDQKQALTMYNAKLANNLGNLLNRVVVLSLKLDEKPGILDTGLQNRVYAPDAYNAPSMANLDDQSRPEHMSITHSGFQSFAQFVALRMHELNLKGALDTSFYMLDVLNKFADDTEPWITIKNDQEETRAILYSLAEGLRQVGLQLYPFFPEKMSELFKVLGLEHYPEDLDTGKLRNLIDQEETFHISKKSDPLYPRLEFEKTT